MIYRFALVFSLALLVGDLPGFAQIGYPGGVGYPGGGYPGGGYPGGGYPGGGYPGGGGMGIPGIGGRRGRNQNNPTDTISGKINRIASSQLVVNTDDNTQVQIALDRNTKYFNASGGTARYGDFDTGDRISVDAARDNQNYLHGLRVSMVEKGTKNTSDASPSNSSGSKDDDPDRPKLKRASNSGSGADDSSSRPKAQITDGDSSSNDNDPDRPRLRRAPSSASADSSSSSSEPATVASNRPAPSASPKPLPRESDDPGPPSLKRNAPARVDNTPVAGSEVPANPNDSVSQAQAIADRYKNPLPELAENRPSIHAEEVHGTTRTPAAPIVGPKEEPPSLNVPDREPSVKDVFTAGPKSSDPVIQGAREAAAQFTESLPNYIVKQMTTRYQTDAAHGNRTSWQALDVVTADVVAEGGKESYKNIQVNGKTPKDDVEKTGSWSTGEFATVLQGILSPYTEADFHNKRATTISNHPAWRYDYSVDQPRSGWHVYASSASYVPGYTGSIWIDKDTFRVLRIEMSAVNMPKSFALDTVESAVDYDYVLIGDQKFLLPTHSEALSCVRGTGDCTRNVIEFRNYKKFGADTSISFDK